MRFLEHTVSIRVVVVDDHPAVRAGLVELFSRHQIEVVAEASNGQKGIAAALAHEPDLVIMDVRMPEVDGLEALERLSEQAPNIRVLMFSNYDNPTYVARAVAWGAVDYVLKTSSPEEIVSAVRRAASGNPLPDNSLFVRIKSVMSKRRDTTGFDKPLTNREIQVLRHLALGLSNREIGRSLDISVETVKEHVQNVLRKIDANDRTQAAVWAVKRRMTGVE